METPSKEPHVLGYCNDNEHQELVARENLEHLQQLAQRDLHVWMFRGTLII